MTARVEPPAEHVAGILWGEAITSPSPEAILMARRVLAAAGETADV